MDACDVGGAAQMVRRNQIYVVPLINANLYIKKVDGLMRKDVLFTDKVF